MKYETVPSFFVSHDVLVPVSDAIDYGHDLLAGFDNLLIELGNELVNGLPGGLPEQQRRAIGVHTEREVQRAREAVEEQL